MRRKPARRAARRAFAVAARQRLQALVAASDGRVGLLPGKRQDHYGRTLAHVYGANGDNLEAQMLAEGLGFQVAVAPNVDLVPVSRRPNARARRVWAVAPVACTESGADQRSGFAVVSGRVSKERNRGGVWIELQGRWYCALHPICRQFDAAA
jgi:hypothetical protein